MDRTSKWCQDDRSGPWGQFNIGILAYEEEDYFEALHRFQNAYELNTTEFLFELWLARTLVKMNACSEAKPYITKMRNRYLPNNDASKWIDQLSSVCSPKQ